MKRNAVLSLILVIIVVSFIASCNFDSSDKEAEYFYKINSIIKDMDFFTVKAENDKIILYNREQEIIKEIPFADYDENIRFIYARKEESVVYFIITGAVDDEQGIMFINSDSNGVLDGIKTINRIGCNSYQYSTN